MYPPRKKVQPKVEEEEEEFDPLESVEGAYEDFDEYEEDWEDEEEDWSWDDDED
ncbi:hypothetical protein [Thermococcus henrietii]|uniref:hypothetical protein n=1 Tax=Thermococcus henrietii TaxID=2016361 RepID=UPI00156E1AE3|nr:hypothetical protein [Thermococcus henrietii]